MRLGGGIREALRARGQCGLSRGGKLSHSIYLVQRGLLTQSYAQGPTEVCQVFLNESC